MATSNPPAISTILTDVIPERFIAMLQADMKSALHTFDASLPTDPLVRISRKAGGWITVAPLQRQPESQSLTALKAAIGQLWPMTRLHPVARPLRRPRRHDLLARLFHRRTFIHSAKFNFS